MKHFLYIFLFFCSSVNFAQNLTLSGAIKDKDNNSVPYANVIIFKVVDNETTSSAILKGVSTDEFGRYMFGDLQSGNYKIKVSFIGFSDAEKTIELKENSTLAPIILTEIVENIGEVVISTKRPTLKKEVDRLVFNVANTALSEGTILEVLKSTPGVLIFDGNISVKNITPVVYINDRKVNLSPSEISQLLESASANSIQKVEVITNPPAKYDAESGAVLNIVMLKNLITGYRANVFTNYTQGVFPRYNVGINQFYKTKKISLNGSYSFTKSKINRNDVETVDFINANNSVTAFWENRLNRNTRKETHNLNFNADYDINDRNTLSLSSNLLFLPYFKYSTKGESLVLVANKDLDFYFNSKNLSRDEKYNLGFDLEFVHRFKNSAKLSINSHITSYDYNRKQAVNSDYFNANYSFDFETAFKTLNNQNTNIFTSQIDYELPLDANSSFSTGVKASHIKTRSDITQFDIDINTSQQTLNANNTNNYHYKESVFAGYVSYSKQWDKWNASIGFRLEQTKIDGESITTNEKNTQDYLELFPTANLSFELSDKTTIYTNVKRSIERPIYKDLNPFKFYLNDNTVRVGNPTLQPAFTNQFLLGTTISKYNIELYYRETASSIFELPRQDNENNTLTFTAFNLDKTKEFFIDFSTSFDVLKNWSVYFYTSFYNTQDESVINNAVVKKNQWSNYTFLSNSFSFLKDDSLSLDYAVTYIGENQQGFRDSELLILSNLALKKRMLKNKGVLSLSINDLFNAQVYKIHSDYANQNSFQLIELDSQYIKLGFNYKFGNTTLKTNQSIKSSNETNRLSN